MKLIKNFRMFESVYNFEEFVEVITRELMRFRVDASNLDLIISQKEPEIRKAIEDGQNPTLFAKDLVKELELDKAYNIGMKFPYSIGGDIKYM